MNYGGCGSRENLIVGKQIAWRLGMTRIFRGLILVLVSARLLWAIEKPDDAPTTTILGYVRDSGCVHQFHEVVKPLPNGCLEACVRAGSALVILSKNEEVFHPVSPEMPDVNVRARLLPFAGKFVKVTGKLYDRGGSQAITLEQIEDAKE